MVALRTPNAELGWKAPDFALLSTNLDFVTLDKVAGERGLVVMFICNHCPYVKAILHKIIDECKALKKIGVNSVAIMSNDAKAYPEDSFTNMQKMVAEQGLPFPYLYDETQEVAELYGAVCTPDFFGFNANLELQYRGRLDASGREAETESSRDLFNAMSEISIHGHTTQIQHPSIGCSIKWKEESQFNGTR
jgi:peroxiredoxin